MNFPSSPRSRTTAAPGCATTSRTDLRPSGKADIDGRRVSVVAVGRMIPQDTELVVVDVEGSEIRVRPLHPLPDEEQD